MEKRTCITCKFYASMPGECRRRSPQPIPMPKQLRINKEITTVDLTWVTDWAKVGPVDWCGEWSDGSCDFCGAPADYEKKMAGRKKF